MLFNVFYVYIFTPFFLLILAIVFLHSKKCSSGSSLQFSSCLSQICQEPVPRQDQPEHTEGRGPADQPRAGRGSPPESAGPTHMAGH